MRFGVPSSIPLGLTGSGVVCVRRCLQRYFTLGQGFGGFATGFSVDETSDQLKDQLRLGWTRR